MFSGIKNFLSNIREWFDNVFHGRFKWGDRDSYEEARGRKSAFIDNSTTNSGSPYSGVDSVADLYAGYNAGAGQGALTSLVNKYSEAGITGQQAALNEMQMDNQRRQYAFQVQGMQEAGLNPALMYESGAQSAPSAPAPTQGASISDLIQLMLADKQSKYLQAQTDNTNADTDKKKAETENMQLINRYYPQVTETDIKKVLSDIGVNEERIEEIQSNVNLNELDAELKRIETRIRSAEADESSAYYKATRELQQAKTETERAHARDLLADAFMKEIEGMYEANTNTKMSSSSLLAIASALGTIFSNSDDFPRFVKKYIYDPDDKHGWLGQMAIDKYWDWYAKKHFIQGATKGGGGR